MNKLIALLLLAFTAACMTSQAQAQGGGVHGGGDIVFRDGKWVLKDLFAQDYPTGQRLILDTTQTGSFLFIKRLVELYSGIDDSGLWDFVFGNSVEIRFVDKLPCEGAEGVRQTKKERLYGCTSSSGITFLLAAEFSRLDYRQKILAILHQRAHAFDPTLTAHMWIEPMIHGIHQMLVAIEAEYKNNGAHTLQPNELNAIHYLANNPYFLSQFAVGGVNKRAPHSKRFVTPLGGGLLIVSDSRLGWNPRWIDADSSIGVGSVMIFDTETCPVKWEKEAPFISGGSSVIRFSSLTCATVREKTKLQNVRMERQMLQKHMLKSDIRTFLDWERDLGITRFKGHSDLSTVTLKHFGALDISASSIRQSTFESECGFRDEISNSTIERITFINTYWRFYSGHGIDPWVRMNIKNKNLSNRTIQINHKKIDRY